MDALGGAPLIFPGLGFGTGKRTGYANDVQAAVEHAITVGYRYIDCAWIYKTEDQVGRAIQNCIARNIVERSDLFVSTRLWNNFHARGSVKKMLMESLQNLQMNYVDLFLIHWPMGFKEDDVKTPIGGGADKCYSNDDYVDTWKGMVDCYEAGLARAIGLANFNSVQIDRILINSYHRPAVNVIELHPFFRQEELHRFCLERGIEVIAEFPFGFDANCTVPGFVERTVEDPKIVRIADRLNKTPSQVVFRYLVYHRKVSVIITSLFSDRITSDSKITDFHLSPTDVSVLHSLNINKRINVYMICDDHQHYPFGIDF